MSRPIGLSREQGKALRAVQEQLWQARVQMMVYADLALLSDDYATWETLQRLRVAAIAVGLEAERLRFPRRFMPLPPVLKSVT